MARYYWYIESVMHVFVAFAQAYAIWVVTAPERSAGRHALRRSRFLARFTSIAIAAGLLVTTIIYYVVGLLVASDSIGFFVWYIISGLELVEFAAIAVYLRALAKRAARSRLPLIIALLVAALILVIIAQLSTYVYLDVGTRLNLNVARYFSLIFEIIVPVLRFTEPGLFITSAGVMLYSAAVLARMRREAKASLLAPISARHALFGSDALGRPIVAGMIDSIPSPSRSNS